MNRMNIKYRIYTILIRSKHVISLYIYTLLIPRYKISLLTCLNNGLTPYNLVFLFSFSINETPNAYQSRP